MINILELVSSCVLRGLATVLAIKKLVTAKFAKEAQRARRMYSPACDFVEHVAFGIQQLDLKRHLPYSMG